MSNVGENNKLSYHIKRLEDRIENFVNDKKEQITITLEDYKGKRKISVRGEYITKIKLAVRKVYAIALAVVEDSLQTKKETDFEKYTGQDESTLKDIKQKKIDNGRKMAEHEERLREIENIKNDRNEKDITEKLAQSGFDIPTSDPGIQSGIQLTPQEEVKPTSIEPTSIEPEVSNPEEVQTIKNEEVDETKDINVPFTLNDDQIANIMNGVQQMMENPEGGNSIQNNEEPNTIDEHVNNTIDEVQSGIAQDVQEIQQVDTLIQRFEQPGIKFNEDMNAIMGQIVTAVKSYGEQVSNIALSVVAEKQTEINGLVEENSAKDVQIQNLVDDNAKKDERIKTLEQEKEADQIRIQNGMDAVAERDAKIIELENKVKTLEIQGQQMMGIMNQIQSLQLNQQEGMQREEPAPQKVNAIN